ncbi:MAG: AbrB family transcriptional regulator [Beijerinckiaceae bacterium]
MPPQLNLSRSDLESFAFAIAGAVLFSLLRLPAPALSGAMVGVVVLLAFRRQVSLSPVLRDTGMLLAGITMGSSVTPEMLQGFQKYPLSLMIFAVSLVLTVMLTQALFQRVAGWDRRTSFLAATPGALSTVLVVAAETKADVLKVTVAQSFRLFVLVAVLPSIVVATGSQMTPPTTQVSSLLATVSMLAGGAIVSAVLARLGMAAPWIFGGMVVSAGLHGAGLVVGSMPFLLREAGFCLVGIYIGTRFATLNRALFLETLAVSFGAFLIGFLSAVASAGLVAWLLGLSFGMVLVAFVPGALEAMIVLGAALGLDPIYVGLHHLVRFFGIGLLLPLAVPVLRRWS